MAASSTADLALDDIKKADEIISMAVLGPKSEVITAVGTENGNGNIVAKSKTNKFLSSWTLSNSQRQKKKPQRQYSNAFPCPMIRSETLESPEGSVSSLGLVHSTPFASLAMTSVHAKRARSNYSKARTVSDHTNNPNELTVSNNGLAINGGHSAPTAGAVVNSRWPSRSKLIGLPRQSSLPCAPASNNRYLTASRSRLSSASSQRLAFSNNASRSRSPMALSINEEGEEFYEDGLFNEKLFNEKPTTAGANPPLLVDKSPASVPEHEICRNVLQHQRSSRPYGLRRQVTIHEDSMSIADSIFSMRVANALPPNSGMNGRHSRQSSLSIQSASGIRASPTIVRGQIVPGLSLNRRPSATPSQITQNQHPTNLPGVTNNQNNHKLPRQESSFTQEEIYSLQEAFNQMDLDGDGHLNRQEIEKVMGNVLSEADLNDLLNDLDTDQNGEVEWHEFLAVMKIRMREPESVKMLKEAFRVFNSDGVLTAEQMRTHLFAEMKNNCIDIELNEMLKALDQDNDGKIKVDDFIRLLTQENSIIKEDGGNSRCGDSCVIL